jgi:cytochrome b involved in lipid metabolism
MFCVLAASVAAYVSEYSLSVVPGNSIDKRGCNHYPGPYSNDDIASHFTKECCWIVVYNHVYDVSASPEDFTCGDDNTRFYFTKHGVNTGFISTYFIGDFAGSNTGTVNINIKGAQLPQYTDQQAMVLKDKNYVMNIFAWLFKA